MLSHASLCGLAAQRRKGQLEFGWRTLFLLSRPIVPPPLVCTHCWLGRPPMASLGKQSLSGMKPQQQVAAAFAEVGSVSVLQLGLLELEEIARA